MDPVEAAFATAATVVSDRPSQDAPFSNSGEAIDTLAARSFASRVLTAFDITVPTCITNAASAAVIWTWPRKRASGELFTKSKFGSTGRSADVAQ